MSYTKPILAGEVAAGFTAAKNGDWNEVRARFNQVNANVSALMQKRYIDVASKLYKSHEFRLYAADYTNPNYQHDTLNMLCFPSEYRLNRRGTGSNARVKVMFQSNRAPLPPQMWEPKNMATIVAKGCLAWAKANPEKAALVACMPAAGLLGAYFSSWTLIKGASLLAGGFATGIYGLYNLLDP